MIEAKKNYLSKYMENEFNEGKYENWDNLLSCTFISFEEL